MNRLWNRWLSSDKLVLSCTSVEALKKKKQESPTRKESSGIFGVQDEVNKEGKKVP